MVKVYFSNIFELKNLNSKIETLPEIRKQYVLDIKDLKRQKQSICVWLLLEYCIKQDYFGFQSDFVQENNVFREKNNNFYFSLAHSGDFVVAALSDNKVGVDIERCCEKVLKLKNKPEFTECLTVEDITLKWTKKESLFKCKHGKNFYSKAIFDHLEQKYILTVCTDEDSAEFIQVNPLYL